MKFDFAFKIALAAAALVAAGTYAWNTSVDRADSVAAAGVDTPDGFAVEGFGFNRQGGFVCVTRRTENPFEPGQKRYTMTFYELVKTGSDGEARLHLLGSRCIDYDQGPDLVKFPEVKGESPNDLKEAFAKINKQRATAARKRNQDPASDKKPPEEPGND